MPETVVFIILIILTLIALCIFACVILGDHSDTTGPQPREWAAAYDGRYQHQTGPTMAREDK